MSLIPHVFPRSMFDMDLWSRPHSLGFGPSTLDLFDPFDELDHIMSRNLRWLNRPDFFNDFLPSEPKVPQKYRIKVDCRGYSADSLKVKVSDDKQKLIVSGKEGENKSDDDDYHIREFKKSYKLPPNAEVDKMVSFLASNGQLVIELPLKIDKEQAILNKEDYFPRVVENQNGGKQVEMNFSVPNNIEPSKVKVTCKDRDVIIQAEDKQERPDGISQMSFYRRTTLPENTDFNSLKCHFDKNMLSLKADLNSDLKSSHRQIPIEINNGQKSVENK
ncbi:alpha-crystallin A chain-like [Brachionus plicatilis]|uniref:Alpha-crystallin A chain-like n=1 Tax=Brachionus plicatilis TaxID=10195 RepID=A0A3M7QA10_BRAPC|nr:alpha-crystallin A chain-like [Brachionus plicatilis]